MAGGPDIGNGLDFEARGEGRPVLFLHGMTFDRRLLLEASEPVFAATRARRLYVDLPGHGGSPPDERAASAEGLVEALGAFCDAHCAGAPPIVVAHSYGGYLALGLAAQRPVAGLLLVTPVVEPDPGRRRLPPRRVAVRDELVFSPEGAERATFEEIAVLQTASVLSAYQRLVHPASERTDRAFLEAVRRRYVLPVPLWPQLQARQPPLTVLCGRDDHWVGYEDALSLVRAFDRAELTVLSHCGQLLPIEAGERYRAAVTAFLARA